MSKPPSTWHTVGLPMVLGGLDLGDELLSAALRDWTGGDFDEAAAAALLVALRMKGESAAEIAAAVRVLRESMVRVEPAARPVIDTCGTGGDGTGTFNVSTATALVVAATGMPVVKHGNRSVSSRSGSADVLLALGVPVESGPAWTRSTLDRHGFGFCFAPQHHPALAKVAPLRRKLGVRTIFNLLGPLLNPAGAEYQLLGVGQADLLDRMAGAAAALGVRRAILVHGDDGLDEVSLMGPTQVRWVHDGRVEAMRWTPADFGLESIALADILSDGPEASAAMVRGVLEGVDGPPRWIVLANAAAALLAAERVATLPDGVREASAAIDSGRARRLLEDLRQ